jgi:D-sedoheptulose 7-phosphate isomerase
MKKDFSKIEIHLELLVKRYPLLASVKDDIHKAYRLLEQSFGCGCKLLVAGNGGSAADAEHIVGELMKSFCANRKISPEFTRKLVAIDDIKGNELARDLEQPLPAIALTNHSSLTTAYLNDVNGEEIFAQQLFGYGKKGDVFLALSTSGNSRNIIYAAIVAKAMDIKVIGLTGIGGELSSLADVAIQVPMAETYLIQELHLPIYHCLCMMLEERFFGENS